MPGAYAIDESRSLVLSRAWGVLTDEDLLGHVRALRADTRFRPHFSQLADFLGLTSVQVTPGGIAELASLNPFGSGSRRALAVTRPLALGMGRMYQILREKEGGDVLEIFQDMDAALRWLGLERDKDVLVASLAAAPELNSAV